MEKSAGFLRERKKKIKLDLIDKKIHYLLSRNCRLNTSFIAKVLKKSKTTIEYKIKRLEKEIELSYWLLPNIINLGYKEYVLLLKTNYLEEELKDYVESLKENIDFLSYIISTYGRFDMFMGFFARDEEHLKKELSKIFNDKISSYVLCQKIDQHPPEPDSFNLSILDKELVKDPYSFINYKGEEDYKVDKKDIEILEQLYKSPRMKLTTLSDMVGLDRNTIKMRIIKMMKSRIIIGFITHTPQLILNLNSYYVLIKLKKPDKANKIISFARRNKNGGIISEVIGDYSLTLPLVVKDFNELNIFIDELKKEFKKEIFELEILQPINLYYTTFLSDKIIKDLKLKFK